MVKVIDNTEGKVITRPGSGFTSIDHLYTPPNGTGYTTIDTTLVFNSEDLRPGNVPMEHLSGDAGEGYLNIKIYDIFLGILKVVDLFFGEGKHATVRVNGEDVSLLHV